MNPGLVMLLVFAGLLGLAIGSFLNVVVYRVPAGRSLTPGLGVPELRHRDPQARQRPGRLLAGPARQVPRLRAADLGALPARRGRHRGRLRARRPPASARPCSRRRRAQDAVAGAIELVAFLTLTAVSIALALIDLDTKRLPNVIVVPALLAGVVLLGAAAVVRGDWPALAGALLGGAGLFLLYLCSRWSRAAAWAWAT